MFSWCFFFFFSPTMAALRFAVLCASAGLGCAYVLWKFRRKKGEASPFRFDAPLRPDVKLPDGPVESGASVELTDEYRKQKMRHLAMSGAISSEYLEKLQPIIKNIFVPQKVHLFLRSACTFIC
jgi:hypothetical protein